MAANWRHLQLSSSQLKVDRVFDPCRKTGVSEWVKREQLGELSWGNNGIARHGIFFNDTRYLWEKDPAYGKIERLRTVGFSANRYETATRPIRTDIRRRLAGAACVVCGSTSQVVVDHKNDMYNDPRVLNVHTQTMNDFQCLCTHCNLQKREVSKKTKMSGIRYGATNIPHLAVFGIDFVEGGSVYDRDDIDAMKGTFWYDPIAFVKALHTT